MKTKNQKSKKNHDKNELKTENKNFDNNDEKSKQDNKINKNDICNKCTIKLNISDYE